MEEVFCKIRQEKRFGLLGMEERVRMMNGTFRLQSAPGECVKIFIEFPGLISQQEEQANTEEGDRDDEHAEADS